MSNREPMTLEQAIEFLYNLVSGNDHPQSDDDLDDAETSDLSERRTRRDYATAERPERHRDRWDEIEMEAALALSGIGWSRYKIGELLDRAPDAVRRIVQRQRDTQ